MKKSIMPFVCGALTSGICVSTALAGGSYSGRISFNTNSLLMNGKEVLTAGESLTTEAGAQVPSSILYTDENGGGTYYVPIRPFAQALDAEVNWDEDAIYWGVEGEQAVKLLPTVDDSNTVYDGYIEDIEAVLPEDGVTLLREEYRGTENFKTTLIPEGNKGNMVSVIVTNQGQSDIVFRLGIQKDDTVVATSIRVPDGEVRVRTFRMLPDSQSGAEPYVEVGNGDGVCQENSFTVTAIQFDTLHSNGGVN